MVAVAVCKRILLIFLDKFVAVESSVKPVVKVSAGWFILVFKKCINYDVMVAFTFLHE